MTRLTVEAFGQTVVEREVSDACSLTIGEHPGATVVLPTRADVHTLALGATLTPGPLVGSLVGNGYERALSGTVELQPGDQAKLYMPQMPHVRITVARQVQDPSRFGHGYSVRDALPILTYGLASAVVLALLVTSVVYVAYAPVHGTPEGQGSSLVRAMYNVAPESHPVHAPKVANSEVVVHAREPVVEMGPSPDIPDIVDAQVFEHTTVLEGLQLSGTLDSSEGAVDEITDRVEEPQVFAVLGTTRDPGASIGDVLAGESQADLAKAFATSSGFVEGGRAPGATTPRSGHDNGSDATSETTRVGVAHGVAAVAPKFVCDDPEASPLPQADVVFVIDVSTTMRGMLDAIEQGISEVDAQVRHKTEKPPHYGLVVFVDDVLVTNWGQPYTDITDLRRELHKWRRFAASNRQVKAAGSNVDWPENSLDALNAAAREFAWRPAGDTLRLVVHATDDDFGEAPAVQSGLPVASSYRDTVEGLRTRSIRVASFTAKLGGECECLDVTPGWRSPYKGQASIPDITAGVAFDIDEVARGELSLAAAVSTTVANSLCKVYPYNNF